MFGRIRNTRAKRGDGPHPWYRNEDAYSWLEVRRGRRQLARDIERFDGMNESCLEDGDRGVVSWMIRKGFLTFDHEDDGTVTFHYTGRTFV